MKDARGAGSYSCAGSHEGAGAAMHGTTIICVRKDGLTAMAGDGQVSLGASVVKNGAKKVRRLKGGGILAGFAGATADAFTLLERLETKLEKHPSQLARACVELAKDWRSDKYLRQLQAMLIVADASVLLLISGSGDVIEPDDGVLAVGSGGLYALASARTLLTYAPHMDAEAVALAAMETAAGLCVFTNRSVTVETLRPAETAV